jgi:hypothetical protein
MKDSWRTFIRRIAAATVFSGSVAWSSAMCYAVQLAFDSASDPVYASGWTEGLNGGNGFGPWNFDGTYDSTEAEQLKLDDGLKAGTQTSSLHNDLGRAWVMTNPKGRDPEGVDPANPPAGTDIARAGRSLSSLQVGQTLTVVIDNPSERAFYRGWTVKLVSGAANACYNGDNCTTPAYDPGSITTRLGIGTFEYFTDGQWYDGNGGAPLLDTDTSDSVEIAITLTGTDSYNVTMTSPGNPVHTDSGTLDGTGSIDWLMIEFYNTDSDAYPVLVAGARATDFYIRSLEITGPAAGLPGDYNDDGVVDAADYTVWRNNLGESDESSLNGNGDGMNGVDPGDYAWWKQHFGDSLGSGGIASSGSAVPEPSTVVYIVAGFAALLAMRSKKGPIYDAQAENWS